MANAHTSLKSLCIDIANAIRSKTGSTDAIKADDFPSAIAGISVGGGLNFEVVGSTTQPTNPSENTIWVNTNTTISEWAFSPEEPVNPVSNMVWIKTKLNGSISFNALKKNGITLFPMSSAQYLNGTWQSKSTQIYQNGWKSWWSGQLYESGDSFVDVTGGWVAVKQKYSSDLGSVDIAVVEKESTLLLSVPARENGFANCGAMMTVNMIDLTNVNTITVTGVCSYTHAMNRLYVTQNNGTGWASQNAPAAKKLEASGATVLDVSNLTGSYYVAVSMYGTTAVSYEMTSCMMN